MSAAITPGALPGDSFWDRLHLLECRHRDLQSRQDKLRRSLDEVNTMQASEELHATWKSYCEVIAELDSTAEKFCTLRADGP